MSTNNEDQPSRTNTPSPGSEALRVNEIDNENDFVPLSDSDDEEKSGAINLQPTASEIELEKKEDAIEEAEAYDDYDGHFDNPTESATPVPVPILASEDNVTVASEENNDSSNELAENNDFIAFSSSESEKDDNDDETAEKKEDVSEKNQKEKENGSIMTDFPWIVNHDHSRQKEVSDWLTLEIKDFVSYISPSKNEIESRNVTIRKIRESVKELWPDADLHVFGSYATDLYLPGSDIDCVINSKSGDKDNRNALYQLANHLSNAGLAIDVEVISKARVPIIKFIEPESKIHIDISFERTNGVDAAKLIRSWLDSTPGLRELVLIVKQFLHARKLNNVHTGGLGGFSIICLVFSFLHTHPRIITNEILAKDNLGVLLIDFFELYGKNFGYDDVAISMLDGNPHYLPKRSWKALHPIRNPFSLAIQDPGDADNNISRGSFNIRDIKKAFAGTFDMLTNQCFELHEVSYEGRYGMSILGSVIKYRGKQRNFKDERKLVVNKAIAENEEFHNKRSRSEMEDSYDTTLVGSNSGGEPDKKKQKRKKGQDTKEEGRKRLSKKEKKEKRKAKRAKKKAVADSDDGYVPQV